MRLTTASGVPAGTEMPPQLVSSTPGMPSYSKKPPQGGFLLLGPRLTQQR